MSKESKNWRFNETTCQNGCCTIFKRRGPNRSTVWNKSTAIRAKKTAGVIFIDHDSNRILLVQSYSHCFGPPKGAIESCDHDNVINCAIREASEETGIVVDQYELLPDPIKLGRYVFFIYSGYKEINLKNISSEITGVGWVSLECAKSELVLNNPCRKLFKQIDRGVVFKPISPV
jgi:hypothetical protein